MSETNLTTLIRSMQPRLCPGLFVFVTIPPSGAIPAGIAPIMMFQEAEGITLIAPAEQVEAVGLPPAFPSRMITLNINSSLESVGFLAAITARLAAAGIAVNPISGFHHDHLFVLEIRAEEAMAILEKMMRENSFKKIASQPLRS
ncbi:MAG: hypothetical protein JWM91_3574 [Rhodospirillales bacterium]|nr:hypothetical protein [Rhodospirillales bacterium]